MLVEQINQTIQLTQTKKIHLKIGDIVKASVISKKGNRYILKIKSELFEAISKIPLKDSVLLEVKQLSPEIVLKIVNPQIETVEFIKKAPAYLDEPSLILKGLLPKLSNAIKEKNITTILSILIELEKISPPNLKEKLNKLQKELIDNKFDETKLKKILDKLKSFHQEKDLSEKLIGKFKQIFKHYIDQQTNTFMLVPLIINNKEEKLYIKQESHKHNSKKQAKIRVFIDHSFWGFIQIDALSIDNKIFCNLSFEKKTTFTKALQKQDELKQLLGDNIDVSLQMLEKKPVMVNKQLNLKI